MKTPIKHLCLVYHSLTNQPIQWFEGVEAEDFYYARHKIAKVYAQTNPQDDNWKVDSCEI